MTRDTTDTHSVERYTRDGQTFWTVNVHAPDGQINDLNAEGEPITSPLELAHEMRELRDQGFFDQDTETHLIEEAEYLLKTEGL